IPLVPATFAICTLSTRHAALVAGADYTSRPNLTRRADLKLRLAPSLRWTVPSSPVDGGFNPGGSDGIPEIRKSRIRGGARLVIPHSQLRAERHRRGRHRRDRRGAARCHE